MKRIKKFIINAVIMTLASFLMRTISVGFNVYISNKIGAAGMGLFSLISSVYSFALTFATSGIFIAATRMTSAALAKNNSAEANAAMKRCILYGFSFGAVAGIVLFLSSPYIGQNWLSDGRTVLPLKILSVTLPLISVSAAINGYFTSVRRAYKNAATQIFEQAVKIILTIYVLNFLVPAGVEYACIAIVSSGAVAETVSFLFMLFGYLSDKRKHFGKAKKYDGDIDLTKKLFGITIPISFSSYVRSGLSTLEHILIPYGLERSGASRERSLAAYGTLHSMVLPVVLFPSAIIISFSNLLVPELSECQAQKNNIQIKYIVSRVFQLALLFSIGVSGIMTCFSSELGFTIYGSADAGKYIKILSPLIPIMYIDTTVDSMLKGLGKQVYTMNVNIVDSLLSVILVFFLLPPYGINGYIITIFITEIINAAMSIYHLLKVSDIKTNIIKWIIGPLVSICGATSVIKIFSEYTDFYFNSRIVSLIFYIALSSVIYFVFAYLIGCFSRDDIVWIKRIFKK